MAISLVFPSGAHAQSTASAEAQCVDGRWEISITGNCIEQYVDCVGTVAAQPATGANTMIRNYSRCPADKEACFWDIQDSPAGSAAEEIKHNDPSHQTDTMFSILPGSGADGFIERNRSYKGPDIIWNGVKTEREKLLWISRKGAPNDQDLRLMIPTKETDHQQFLKAAEKDGLIETDEACMPIEIRLCQGLTAPAARPCPPPAP